MGIGAWIGAMVLREKVREKDGIDGSIGDDCLTTFCCLPCSICQMTNHLGTNAFNNQPDNTEVTYKHDNTQVTYK